MSPDNTPRTHGGLDPAPDYGELTRFQIDVLFALAQTPNLKEYGLAIKQLLSDRYQEEVNHGRLYPTLDQLARDGLIRKGKLDDRTNLYTLTPAGQQFVASHAKQQLDAARNVDAAPGDTDALEHVFPAGEYHD